MNKVFDALCYMMTEANSCLFRGEEEGYGKTLHVCVSSGSFC